MKISKTYAYYVTFKTGSRSINKIVTFSEKYSKEKIMNVISNSFLHVTSVESIREIDEGFYIEYCESESTDINYN